MTSEMQPETREGPVERLRRPAWFDPYEEKIRDMIPNLKFLACLLRDPQRMERCPGMSEGDNRRLGRAERTPAILTNVDYGVDFLTVSIGFPYPLNYAIGSVGRAMMPGQYDNFGPEPAVEAYKRWVATNRISWHDTAVRRRQYDAWKEAVRLRALRPADQGEMNSSKVDLALEILYLITLDPKVAVRDLKFEDLAPMVRWRSEAIVRERYGGGVEDHYF